ncbi:MAG: hypothetical protein Q7O66_09565, partial [Dehalococcoidia bacterium]|nr:hypothetical protein [Dehalococcoidia bacterium]
MTRIAEFSKKYPTIPKDVLVKWELMNRGIRDSKDLDKVSFWRRAAEGAYLSFDEDLTLERIKKETPWRVKGDSVLLPDRLYLKTGFDFYLYRKERSPYVIKEINQGKVAIFEGEEMVDVEVYEPPREKERLCKELKTSKGKSVRDFMELFGNCYSIYPGRFCEYFNDGDACKFCNYNPTQEDGRAIGVQRPKTLNLEETAEAFKIIGAEMRLVEGFMVGGGFKRSETEASFYLKFVEKLNSSLSYRTDMKVLCQAMSRRDLQRLKDAGLTSVRLHMETFDEQLFDVMLPGKAKHLSRQGWLDAFQDSVEIFGVGNVGAKFTGGLTMQGPYGHATWQEARDSHMEGDRWMISHGVLPSMGALRWAPGSAFSHDPANWNRFPPTEYYLDLLVAHHSTMKEYGLYEKLNKHLCCGLCFHSRHIYIGEMG